MLRGMCALRAGFVGLVVVALVATGSLPAQQPPRTWPGLVRALKASGAIVRVEVSGTATAKRGEALVESRKGGTGTGFVIHSRPYIVTNAHVVSAPHGWAWKTVDYKVTFMDGGQIETPVKAQLRGLDEPTDLAVLAIDPRDIPLILRDPATALDNPRFHGYLAWGQAEVGQDVMAVGFARGIAGSPSVTKGIVGEMSRQDPSGDVADLIQTDAPINPGNSGGPLLNLDGRVVGVNTFSLGPIFRRTVRMKVTDAQGGAVRLTDAKGGPVKLRDSKGDDLELFVEVPVPDPAQGLNYARSSWTAQKLVEKIIEKGKVYRAGLGIADADSVRIPAGGLLHVNMAGVAIKGFTLKSPAAAAGLQIGDVITGIHDGAGVINIACIGDLLNAQALIESNKKITVYFRRPNAEMLKLIGLIRKPGQLPEHVGEAELQEALANPQLRWQLLTIPFKSVELITE